MVKDRLRRIKNAIKLQDKLIVQVAKLLQANIATSTLLITLQYIFNMALVKATVRI